MLGELRKYLQFCTPFHSVCQFTDETYVPLARWGSKNVLGCLGCTSHRCSGESGAWHRFFFAKMLYLCTTSLPLWCLCAHLFRLSVSDAFLFVPVCLVSAIMLPDIPRGTTTYYYVLARTTKTEGKQPRVPKSLLSSTGRVPKVRVVFLTKVVFMIIFLHSIVVLCTRWVPL